jgi:putative transposase
VRKIAPQGEATWHCIKGDFAHAARRSCHNPAMSRYRRPKIEGGILFFTVVLADRSSALLVKHIERLRQVYHAVQARLPFATNAICILSDHLHAIWTLPPGDADFASGWSQIKGGFSRAAPAAQLRSRSQHYCVTRCKGAKRESGNDGFGSMQYAMALTSSVTSMNIHFNPVKHGSVTRVCDWPYSSFHRYVTNALLPADGGGDLAEIEGRFAE